MPRFDAPEAYEVTGAGTNRLTYCMAFSPTHQKNETSEGFFYFYSVHRVEARMWHLRTEVGVQVSTARDVRATKGDWKHQRKRVRIHDVANPARTEWRCSMRWGGWRVNKKKKKKERKRETGDVQGWEKVHRLNRGFIATGSCQTKLPLQFVGVFMQLYTAISAVTTRHLPRPCVSTPCLHVISACDAEVKGRQNVHGAKGTFLVWFERSAGSPPDE